MKLFETYSYRDEEALKGGNMSIEWFVVLGNGYILFQGYSCFSFSEPEIGFFFQVNVFLVIEGKEKSSSNKEFLVGITFQRQFQRQFQVVGTGAIMYNKLVGS